MSEQYSHVASLGSNNPLVVCFDDDEDVLNILKMRLNRAGFNVMPIQVDGSETPEVLKELVTTGLNKNPVAVITDYDMKGHTGKEVLDLYNDHYNVQATKPPLYLYTGEADFLSAPGELTPRAKREGFTHVFNKLKADEMVKEIKVQHLPDLPPR